MEIGDIELDLSLSLNGRFGSDSPRRTMGVPARTSSSSLSLVLEAPAADESEECTGGSLIVRSSLHRDEEKGRKKMQCLRRMEVKKRRMEKQRSVIGGRGRGGLPRSRGSSGSGSNSQQDKGWKAAMASPHTRRTHSSDDDGKSSAEQMLRSVLEAMPRVCARVDGPNGGRVEGFLFRYRKGEGFKIVCICHGRFHSPAEFVEHAGGTSRDVAHPLKHIVVCPPSW